MVTEIRILKAEDVAAYRELRLRAVREEPDAFGTSYEEEIDVPLDVMVERLKESADHFVLGTFDPELVGIVGFGRQQRIKRRHRASVWGMYVAPEVRGRGIARTLMTELIARARTQPGLESLDLTVVTANEAARALYSSLWFVSYGIERRALRIGDRYVDMEFMTLRLTFL